MLMDEFIKDIYNVLNIFPLIDYFYSSHEL